MIVAGEVVFSYPHVSLPSLMSFGCRPISIRAGRRLTGDFLLSTFHAVTFIHYSLLKVRPFLRGVVPQYYGLG